MPVRVLLGGFLTIELLISVLIMSAMSTVVLSANSSMSSRLQTDNLAHLIALSIREAQTRALSATAPTGVTDADLIPGYGVYISAAESNKVTVFTETPSGATAPVIYNPDTSGTYGSPRTLGQGYKITRLGATDAGAGGTQISNSGAISIYFHRPRPDPQIYYAYSPTNPTPTQRATAATITIQSPKGGVTKTITVSSTGQISVQ